MEERDSSEKESGDARAERAPATDPRGRNEPTWVHQLRGVSTSPSSSGRSPASVSSVLHSSAYPLSSSKSPCSNNRGGWWGWGGG